MMGPKISFDLERIFPSRQSGFRDTPIMFATTAPFCRHDCLHSDDEGRKTLRYIH